eukprot:Nitzschia sp. Nitz4//scaffold94_size78252//17034//18625//NITZ4_005461-RA/size78252-augustus-gene-0.70-mRNA-1//-1//CDS//3329560359//1492//frame0
MNLQSRTKIDTILLIMVIIQVARRSLAFQISSTFFRPARLAATHLVNPTFVGYKSPNALPQMRLFHRSNDDDWEEEQEESYKRQVVQWYPGHIAKAERQLAETLRAVDVVVEVRDARACKATAHPRVGEWCAGRPRIVVLTHLDMIPPRAVNAWKRAYDKFGAERWDEAPINSQVSNQASMAREERLQYVTPELVQPMILRGGKSVTPVEEVLFMNAKESRGIHVLHNAIYKAGAHVQARRDQRGLKARPLRVGIIGYPNVGKSALINRILGRKRARTANTPGVTRSLQWMRVRTADTQKEKGKEFELLDSPGIIPAKIVDQSDALLLAACNCIGDAAYDNQGVAAYLCEWLKTIHLMDRERDTAPEWRAKCKTRYRMDPMERSETGEYLTGEEILHKIAINTCRGNAEDASRKVLQDFRTGRMGKIALQLAPEKEEDQGHLELGFGDDAERQRRSEQRARERAEAEAKRTQEARETAKKRGVAIPEQNEIPRDGSIGKGMFDGW